MRCLVQRQHPQCVDVGPQIISSLIVEPNMYVSAPLSPYPSLFSAMMT
jgi:hypothetical protein